MAFVDWKRGRWMFLMNWRPYFRGYNAGHRERALETILEREDSKNEFWSLLEEISHHSGGRTLEEQLLNSLELVLFSFPF